jgi:N-acylneuraminate cytidylyltransferase
VLTLAVIPARAGSEGLPGKHLALLGGIPLIVHTIRAALGATRVDRVLVSTNDPAIARVARRAGAEVPFRRPDELARSDTPTLPVIEHAVAWVEARGSVVDLVVTLQPTSPLRPAAAVDAAIDLVRGGHRSAVSISRLGLPSSVIGRVGGGFFQSAFPQADARRQVAPDAARITGAIYVTRRDLLAEGTLLEDRPAALILEGAAAIDIDSADDLAEARRALRAARRDTQ